MLKILLSIKSDVLKRYDSEGILMRGVTGCALLGANLFVSPILLEGPTPCLLVPAAGSGPCSASHLIKGPRYLYCWHMSAAFAFTAKVHAVQCY